jgi:hypothetical protein
MFRLPFAAVALLLLISPPVHADGAKAVADATKALEQLTSYTDGIVKANGRPEFTKPPASEYLARILDLKALAALPPPQPKDISWLVQWADAMNKVNQMVIFVGAQTGSEAERRAAIERNMTEYEDAMFPAWTFMARMQARLLVTGDLFMDSLPAEQRTPARKNGHAQIRDGHMQFVQGALTTIAAGVKPENAHLLTTALRDTATTWAPRMTAAERDRLRSILSEARKAYTDRAVLDDVEGLSLFIETTKPQ